MSLAEPYASVRLLPPRKQMPSWFHSAGALEEVLKELPKEPVVVELGAWLGESSIWFAKQGCKVYAIDPWAGTTEGWNPTVNAQAKTSYAQFLSNVVSAEVTHLIVPVRMTAREAAYMLDIRPDLVYVDAGHDAVSAYEDTLQWHRKLAPKGVLCGDDWTWQSVQDGVTAAARELGATIHVDGELWRLVIPNAS